MSAEVAQLSVVIKGDDEDAEKKIGGINNKVKESSGFFKDGLKNALGFAAGGAIMMGVGAAVSFVTSNLSDMVKQGMDGNQIAAQLAAGLKATHDASGMTADSLDKLSTSIMNQTGIDDDAVKASESMLLTFTNIGKNVFPQATQAVADLATKMNNGAIPSASQMEQASIQLGKALGNPLTGFSALQRVGVTFDAQQKEQIKNFMKVGDVAGAQNVILKEMNKEFGGSADAAGKANGGIAILAAQFDNFKQSLGQAIIPVLVQVMQSLTPITSALTSALPGALAIVTPLFQNVWTVLRLVGEVIAHNLQPAFDTLKGLFADVGGSIKGLDLNADIITPITQLAGEISDGLNTAIINILPVLRQLWTVFTTNILPALQNVWTAISTSLIPSLQNLWNKISPVLIPALQFVGWVLQNVVGPGLALVITIIGKVIDIVAVIIGKIGDFIGWLGHAGDGAKALGGHFQDLLGVVQSVWNSITGAISDAINTVIGWFNTAYNHSYVFKAMVDFIANEFTFAKNLITAVWNGIVGFLQGTWNLITSGARIAWNTFTDNIRAQIAAVQSVISSIVNAIKGPLTSFIDTVKSIGGNIIHGLIDGVRAQISMVGDIAQQIGNTLLNGVKGALGIHSPSQEMHNLGQFISQGLINGVRSIDVASPISDHLGNITSDVSARLGVNVVGGGSGGSNLMRAAASASASGGSGGGGSGMTQHIVIQLDNRTIAEAVVKELPDIVRVGTGIKLW